MEKYYRVKKDTFMWEEGAILKYDSSDNGYRSINDIWNRVEIKNEYISAHIIEDTLNSDWFERVYKINLLSKTVFKLRDQAKELIAKEYNG